MPDQEAPPAPPTDLDEAQRLCEVAEEAAGNLRWLGHRAVEAATEDGYPLDKDPLRPSLSAALHALRMLPRLVTELRAARQARGELQALHSDLHDYDLTAASANRLRRILTTWDEQAAGEGGK
jgi:hypothetical protein